jgi:hypothetical protein
MKNPLEYTLLEIEALMSGDPDAPQSEYTRLLGYTRNRQKEMQNYQVQKSVAVIQHREQLPRRKARNFDAELLDECEVITLESSRAEYSQAPTEDN